ncbi:MAG: RluA family pseudouridine synthase [Verrucomicrobia bacterium]|nr:RluA family pseudouridine synthase [Verrucomicrobiota bacterium]MDA1086095.1 RluA family pseudouridine synthase [Verrucomicrobiota bacterium]
MSLKHHKIAANEAGLELVQYLSGRLDISRRQAKALLDRRNVLVNQRPVWMARHRLQVGDRVTVETKRPDAEALEARHLLFDRDGYLIVNKPPGITTNGESSLETALRTYLDARSIQAVHRLDKDTSGCVLFSRTGSVHEKLIDLFREKAITKTYRAIVHGTVKRSDMEICRPIDSRPAFTRVRLLCAGTLASHLSVQIVTGRTHQIRKHLASIQHSVIGDREYGAVSEFARYGMPPRQMLHAHALRFECPITGQRVKVEAPLPRDFKECLAALLPRSRS